MIDVREWSERGGIAYERRRISSRRFPRPFSGGEKRQPEIRLRLQARGGSALSEKWN